MATTRGKANNLVKCVTEALRKARTELGIDPQDIDLVIRVDVEDKVTFNYHEDED